MVPVISIIIPAYNAQNHVAGFVSQFGTIFYDEVEFIFIDDGSTDHTYELLLSETKSLPGHVRVVQQGKNMGVSAARNLGLQKATGRFLAFIDVDDQVSDVYLSTLLRLAKNNRFDLCVFENMSISGNKPFPAAKIVKEHAVSKESLLYRFLCNPTQYGVCNLLMNRETAMGMVFRTGYKY